MSWEGLKRGEEEGHLHCSQMATGHPEPAPSTMAKSWVCFLQVAMAVSPVCGAHLQAGEMLPTGAVVMSSTVLTRPARTPWCCSSHSLVSLSTAYDSLPTSQTQVSSSWDCPLLPASWSWLERLRCAINNCRRRHGQPHASRNAGTTLGGLLIHWLLTAEGAITPFFSARSLPV